MLRRYWWLILIIILLASVAPGQILAHPEIVRTEPPANAELTAAPTAIRVIFNESVEGTFSALELFDAQTQRVDSGGSRQLPDDPTTLELQLPSLGPGVYTAVWTTVGSDGHKVKGNFVFTVLGSEPTLGPTTAPSINATATVPTPTAPPAPAAPAEQEGPSPVLVALLRALMLLGALGSVGGWFIGAWVFYPAIPTHTRPPLDVARQRWRSGMLTSLALLGLATFAFMLVQTGVVAGQVDAASVQAVVLRTRLGQALLARLLLTLLLLGLLAITSRRLIRRSKLALVLGASLLLTFSLSSHAAAQPVPDVPVLADWFHLTATAVWVGGLLLLVWALPSTLSTFAEKDRVPTLARLIERFSIYALLSVVTLTASGTYSALLHLTALSDLLTSDYGRALLLKLGLFGALIILGVYNMFIVRSRFTAWTQRAAEMVIMMRWQQRFQWALRTEVALAMLVIGVVGFLTNTPPPGVQTRQPLPQPTTGAVAPTLQPSVLATAQPTRTPVPSKPFKQIQTIDDLQVGLEVTPASLGENTFLVTVSDAAGIPVDVQKVEISAEMLVMDMGVTKLEVSPHGTGQYEASKGWLSMVGEWQLSIVIRRADADDVMTTFTVPVGE